MYFTDFYKDTGLSVWDLKDYFESKNFYQTYENYMDLRNYNQFYARNNKFFVALANRDGYELWFALLHDFNKWSDSKRHVLYIKSKEDLEYCYEALLISEKNLLLKKQDCFFTAKNPEILNRWKRTAKRSTK